MQKSLGYKQAHRLHNYQQSAINPRPSSTSPRHRPIHHALVLQSTMPVCIECSYPVSHLYSTYSRADDRALGKGVRLTQCPRCQRFADKYVEYDFVVLFIDLVLIKPQVSGRAAQREPC